MSEQESIELPLPVFIVSDSTGETAERVVRAALSQYENYLVNIKTYTHVSEGRQLSAIFRLAGKEHALVALTLVDPKLNDLSMKLALSQTVEMVDLLGPVLVKLGSHLGGKSPRGVPGATQSLSEEYFRRIDAVEFTIKHDDGAEPRHMHKADIVLVGVSRTSKTPLSMYLAHKGLKVANVPLVLGIDAPNELFEVDQDKIFGLTIDPSALHGIRMARIRSLGLTSRSKYGHLDHIAMELQAARELFDGNPRWPVLDVTSRAVEESAAVILRTLDDRAEEKSHQTTIKG